MNAQDIELLSQKIQLESLFVDRIREYTGRFIIGQDVMIERLVIGLLTRGHILLEGLPGLAKTLAIKTLSHAVNASFSRIQFTPDLLPADILGTMIYNPGTHDFAVRRGPIFANFILADEINRAPAKVQSALLEAMQEKQITIGKKSFLLEEPFLVLATQNPIEQEGTYPLPEAQVDRFMLKVVVGYPDQEEELQILRLNLNGEPTGEADSVIETDQILRARSFVDKVYMDEKIERYILDIVFATRYPDRFRLQRLKPLIAYGASPRATINIAKAARALAFMNKRAFVIPEDIRNVCKDVMRHRIGLTYEAEAENIDQEEIVENILNHVVIP